MSLRVLHVVNHLRPVGNGITNAVVDLAAAQAQAGDVVAVSAEAGVLRQNLHSSGVLFLPMKRTGLAHAWLMRRLLVEHVSTFKPDIVHVHTSAAMLAAAGVGMRRRKPRIIATMHNSFDPKTNLYALADAVIAISSGVAAQLERRPWFARTPITTVLNGYGGAWEHAPSARTERLPSPSVVCVAGLYRRKGIDVLIKAFARIAEDFPLTHLHIVGDGPDRRALADLASEQSCAERIRFLGFRGDVRQIINQADLFVLPSRAEPFGLVLLEARSLGVPIIASAVGGIPDVLGYGEAGMLVEPDNDIQLARAMRRVLEDHASSVFPRHASDLSHSHFSIERQRAETAAVYESVLTVSGSSVSA